MPAQLINNKTKKLQQKKNQFCKNKHPLTKHFRLQKNVVKKHSLNVIQSIAHNTILSH